ncbi:MAG: response regulator transcription factor [Chloroflexi bacterium]|nr:response regulator transcription factor [Chloroflexota bacterium]
MRAMLEAGAVGYVLKVSLARDLVNGIRAAASGSTPALGAGRSEHPAPAAP